MSFAQNLYFPFFLKAVVVSGMFEMSEDLFEIEAEEKVTFYAIQFLTTMISQPNKLEFMMSVIRYINQCVMVVTKIEAHHNFDTFMKSFVDAFPYHITFFDCLDNCMDRNDPNRMIMESIFLNHRIQNIVAAKGE